MDPRTSLYLVLIFIAWGACSQENCLCARGFCDEGWVQYQGSCYKAVMEPTNWHEAEVACQSHGRNSHLASIHSAEENDFIFHLMGKPLDYTNGQAYWIGAHDTFKVAPASPVWHNPPSEQLHLQRNRQGWRVRLAFPLIPGG
uniref:C-type lectin domain-containing protein n=1 Tax=Chrysemys picta bellii TaxID=8478 RepID=A0A8C3HU74_CHRPI